MLMEAERTGEKAVVMVKLEVMVEVEETDEFHDMVEQAKKIVNQRILEGQGFFPYRILSDMVHPGITVEELKVRTIVTPSEEWS